MTRIKCIGIIAEDDSDYSAVSILVKRIVGRDNLGFKKAISHGCGKLKRKAFDFANNLSKRSCDLVLIVHDLDDNNLEDLRKDLEFRISGCSAKNYFICIPVQEIEAWFVSDPETVKKVFKLKRVPKFRGLPETINSPKENLREQVRVCSNKQSVYIHTKHNAVLATHVSIDQIRARCQAFVEVENYLLSHKY